MVKVTILKGNPALRPSMSLRELRKLAKEKTIEIKKDKSPFSAWQLFNTMEKASLPGLVFKLWHKSHKERECKVTVTNPLSERKLKAITLDHVRTVARSTYTNLDGHGRTTYDTLIRFSPDKDTKANKLSGEPTRTGAPPTNPLESPERRQRKRQEFINKAFTIVDGGTFDPQTAEQDMLELPEWLKRDLDYVWPMSVWTRLDAPRDPDKPDRIKDIALYAWERGRELGTFHENTENNEYSFDKLLGVLARVNENADDMSDREFVTVVRALHKDLDNGGWFDPELAGRLGDDEEAKLYLLGALQRTLNQVLHDKVRHQPYPMKGYSFFDKVLTATGSPLNALISETAKAPKGDPQWTALSTVLESHALALAGSFRLQTIEHLVTEDLLATARENEEK